MDTSLTVVLSHDRFPADAAGQTRVSIVVKSDGPVDTADAVFETAGDAVRHAKLSAAGDHLVDYDSFGSDSDYANRCDKVADEMEVVSVARLGEAKDFAVEGIRRDDSDWSGVVCAVDEAEAGFQGVFRMALADGADTRDFEAFLDAMAYVEVTEVSPHDPAPETGQSHTP